MTPATLMQEGDNFFLDGRTPHRVLGRGAALTLYVRGMEKPCETIARAESATPDWQGGIVSIFFPSHSILFHLIP